LPPQQVRGIVGIGCDDVDAIGEFENGGRDHDPCPKGGVGKIAISGWSLLPGRLRSRRGRDGCDIARTAPAPI
jgi:hypothetical protein